MSAKKTSAAAVSSLLNQHAVFDLVRRPFQAPRGVIGVETKTAKARTEAIRVLTHHGYDVYAPQGMEILVRGRFDPPRPITCLSCRNRR